MRAFKVTGKLRDILATKGLNLNIEKDALVFLGSIDFTYVVKLNYKQFHLEVLDILDLAQYSDIYQSDSGFFFVRNP